VAAPKKQRKTPSFTGLRSSSPAASAAMRGNRRAGTTPEILLRDALDRIRIRYRINARHLVGAPDIVIRSDRVAVFCDGDFWHGRQWRKLRGQLARRANPDYWIAKITANRARDRRVQQLLEQQGWRVLRCWESDIRRDAAGVAERIAGYTLRDLPRRTCSS
jgi:DNA mismatch endonuclease (patch repair protein)